MWPHLWSACELVDAEVLTSTQKWNVTSFQHVNEKTDTDVRIELPLYRVEMENICLKHVNWLISC